MRGLYGDQIPLKLFPTTNHSASGLGGREGGCMDAQTSAATPPWI